MLLRPGMAPCKLQFRRLLPRRRRLGNKNVKLSANHNGKTFEACRLPESNVIWRTSEKNLINSPLLVTGFKHQFVYRKHDIESTD